VTVSASAENDKHKKAIDIMFSCPCLPRLTGFPVHLIEGVLASCKAQQVFVADYRLQQSFVLRLRVDSSSSCAFLHGDVFAALRQDRRC